ncbi:MAG: sulfite exporter TauE/SafE family protein [Gammaproteobacteria bacterium]
MDLTLYWFMLPISVLVATTAMMSGIGGAAMFMPIFVIGFPLLGPEYPLESAAAAIGVALLTETFGFGSGFVAYLKRQLIDFRLAAGFALISVPAAIAGALLSHAIRDDVLLFAYGLLMLVLTIILFRGHQSVKHAESTVGAAQVKELQPELSVELHDSDGRVYHYNRCKPDLYGTPVTGFGGFLAGLLSVGIGEVAMPQLVRRCKIPLPVAAATSIAIVIATIAAASFAHISALLSAGGVNAVPWELVMYTVPGVIIGGQIGPRIQGRVDSRLMEKIIAVIFAFIAIAMLWIVFNT